MLKWTKCSTLIIEEICHQLNHYHSGVPLCISSTWHLDGKDVKVNNTKRFVFDWWSTWCNVLKDAAQTAKSFSSDTLLTRKNSTKAHFMSLFGTNVGGLKWQISLSRQLHFVDLLTKCLMWLRDSGDIRFSKLALKVTIFTDYHKTHPFLVCKSKSWSYLI